MHDKAKIEEDVARLKEWYSKQHHLPQNIDEHYFYNFVCGTNSMEKAKRHMDAYFSMRSRCLGMLSGVYPNTKAYRNNLKTVKFAILPDKTAEGYRVLFIAPRDMDPSLVKADAFFLVLIYALELAFRMWPTDMEYIILTSFENVPLSAFMTVNIRHVAVLGKFWVEALPFKLKADHIMNVPYLAEKIEAIFRPFVSKKINERIHLYPDGAKIKEVLPLSMLPAEFGGEGKSLSEMSDYWIELIDSNLSWFEDRLKLCSDESKRSKDSAWKGDLDFGIEGSFKTLNID